MRANIKRRVLFLFTVIILLSFLLVEGQDTLKVRVISTKGEEFYIENNTSANIKISSISPSNRFIFHGESGEVTFIFGESLEIVSTMTLSKSAQTVVDLMVQYYNTEMTKLKEKIKKYELEEKEDIKRR